MSRHTSLALLGLLVGCGAGGRPDAGVSDGGAVDAGTIGGRWTGLPALPRPQQECGVAAVGTSVYVVGGFAPMSLLVADVLRLEEGASAWTPVRPLPRPLHHLNVAVVKGRLYVVGALEGAGFAARGDTLEYDPLADQWTTKAPLPMGSERGSSAMGVIGDEVYVAGGYRGAAVSDFSVFDPATNTHRALPPLPMSTEHVVGATVGRRLYVIGGRAGAIHDISSRVQIYDVDLGRWQAGPDLPTARGGHAGAVLGTRIVVVGGEGNRALSSGVFGETEVLDTETLTWSRGPVMATPRHGTGAATVGGRVIVPGGATVEGLGPVSVVEAFAF